MAAMAIVGTLASELRLLRRLPGPLDAPKVTHAAAILKGLGGGDPDEALDRLMRIAELHVDDRDVQAAFASVGLGTTSESVLGRLEDFAAAHYIDARTARRWSDAGTDKLARLIVGGDPWRQPVARLKITAGATTASVGIDIASDAGVTMHEPELSVDTQAVQLEWPGRVPGQSGHVLSSAPADVQLTEAAHTLRLVWRGDLEPTYTLSLLTHSPWRADVRVMLRGLEVRLVTILATTTD